MILRIRLLRCGRKKSPTYRIVVANSRSPRDGKFLELIGHYNPFIDLTKALKDGTIPEQKFVINAERALHWLNVGAEPTDRVKLFITKTKVLPQGLQKFSDKYSKEIADKIAIGMANPPKEKKAKK